MINIKWGFTLGNKILKKGFFKKNINVNFTNSSGESCLYIVVSKGFLDITRLLIEAGANVDAITYEVSCLYRAAAQGYFNIAKLLIEAGANVNFVKTKADPGSAEKNITVLIITVLISAAKVSSHCSEERSERNIFQEKEKIVELLINNGAKVNAKTTYGRTALNYASRNGFTKAVKLLIDAGANVNPDKEALIQDALFTMNFDIIKLLINSGAKINGNEALKKITNSHVVKSDEATKAVNFLLNDIKINVNHITDFILERVIKFGSIEMLKDLIKAGINIHTTGEHDITYLIIAAQYNKIEAVKLLIESGADVNACTTEPLQSISHIQTSERWDDPGETHIFDYGSTALQIATSINNIEIVKLLLNAGANN